jgi:hypothetical protein
MRQLLLQGQNHGLRLLIGTQIKTKRTQEHILPRTTTVAAPAPKAKAVVPRNNTANVIAGRQARGLSMLEAQNQRRNRQGKVVSAADASYGYIDANGKFVDAYT